MDSAPSRPIVIHCPASRSILKEKKFKLGRSQPLASIKEALTTIFDLDGLLTVYRFYYDGQQIECIADLRHEEVSKPIVLEIEYLGE